MKAYLHLNEILTLKNAHNKEGRNLTSSDLSLIHDGAVVFNDKEIIWVGESKNLPQEYRDTLSYDLSGHTLTPEIVDSHTHIVFAGDRAQEYADRLNGVSYEEIAKRGGGILLTMTQTNATSENELFQSACERIERLHSYGIGTIEIKSGYGLNFEKELIVSQIINRLKKKYAPTIQIFNTYLAAHDVPKNYSSSMDYMKKVVIPLLDELAPKKIIDAVDIFHEVNYFSKEDVDLLFNHAKKLGIPSKIHADELNENDGARIAANHGSLSADHLLRISDEGIEALKQSKTVATLLPGTAFFLGKPLAPARKMLDAGLRVAFASDYNPGSCHCDNLLLIASLASAQMKINQAELWSGITLNSALALGMNNQGAIIPGMAPRFSLFKTPSLSHITYNWGRNFSVNLP